MSKENILHRIRTALGRSGGPPATAVPPVRIRVADMDREARIESMQRRLEALAGTVLRTADPLAAVGGMIQGKMAVASNAALLAECGITGLPGVCSGITSREELRKACATADFGITTADFALADTGTLVMLASPQDARLISLLPPAHIAVVPAARLLSGLDELFSLLPDPARQTSSLVLITGPSRTGDIEQILVRGVHGPGKITVIIVE
jgi:L-lactate dehydrogenase complex protein LldG